jgi:hypothetical protein
MTCSLLLGRCHLVSRTRVSINCSNGSKRAKLLTASCTQQRSHIQSQEALYRERIEPAFSDDRTEHLRLLNQLISEMEEQLDRPRKR